MSDITDEALKGLEAKAALEKKKQEVAEGELIIKERKVTNQLEEIRKNDREMEIANATNYGGMSDAQIAKTQRDNLDYMQAAKSCMTFINKEFDNVIPFFRKNLILIGGKTGEGKSTTVANVVAATMKQKNLKTGKRCRVLVLTNEEKTEDVYNRITCFSQGWSYTNHNKFTDHQINTFDKYIPILAKDGWLTVIDDSFGSTDLEPVSGVTTSLEGIQAIFDGLIRNGDYYDVVIIDYYQNIKSSKKNPYMNEWEVQAAVAAMLDQYKNIYPAPIVLMAQVSPPNEENTIPFKTRIEGRKVILNVATVCIEMVADRENLCTEWFIHKSRFNESVGTKFHTGYDKGQFVLYSDEFKIKVAAMKERAKANALDKRIGIPKEEPTND